MTEYRDFIWKVGQYWTHTFTVTDEDGDAVPLTVGGGEVIGRAVSNFRVASTLDDTVYSLDLSTEDTEVDHAAAGTVQVIYDVVALAPGRYIYSLTTTEPGDTGDLYVVAQGTIVVERTALDVPVPAI